jgi:hypothetical protein
MSYDLTCDATVGEIIDLYDALVNKKQHLYENIVNSITMPFHNSQYMDNLNFITTFDMKTGGSFIASSNFSEENRIQLLHFLATIIQISGETNKRLAEDFLFTTILSYISDCAKKSRILSGYQLVSRAA